MADIDKLIGFMSIMQVHFMNDPDALACIEEVKTVLKQAKAQEPRMDFDGQDVWRCGNCGRTLFHPTHTECDHDAKNIVRFCNGCGKEVDWKHD